MRVLKVITFSTYHWLWWGQQVDWYAWIITTTWPTLPSNQALFLCYSTTGTIVNMWLQVYSTASVLTSSVPTRSIRRTPPPWLSHNRSRVRYTLYHSRAPQRHSFKCHLITGAFTGHISLLWSVYHYVPHMDRSASFWYDLSSALKVFITFVAVICANWLTMCLHQIRGLVHTLRVATITVAIVADPNGNLLGPFKSYYYTMFIVGMHKTIYLPAPYFRIFLDGVLIPINRYPAYKVPS